MRAVFISITLTLVVGVFIAMALIIRDVMPHLGEEDQLYFRSWFKYWGTRRFDRALRSAWDFHIRFFPRSRKRTLLAFVLATAFLSAIAYPIWMAMN